MARLVGNTAPVIGTSAASLTSITEDPATNAGTLVSDLVTSLSITDANGDTPLGLAVTSAASAHGTWQYSTDGGSSWNALTSSSSSIARLLSTAAGNRIRFAPAANFNTDTPADVLNDFAQPNLSVVSWDGVIGTSGGTGDTTATDNTNSFGTTTGTLSIAVTAINDAPVVATTSSSQSVTEGQDLAVAGVSVSDVDIGNGSESITLTVSNGVLTVPTGAITGLSGNGSASVTFSGNLSQLNSALVGLVYHGTPGFVGTDTLGISIDDNGNTGAGGHLTGTGSVGITVNDAALSVTKSDFAATEGLALTNVIVGTLTDAAGNDSIQSQLSVTINWGDTHSSSATLVATSPGVYQIEGSHTYAEEGTYTVTASAVDTQGSTADNISAPANATVADAALTAGALTPPVATEGAAFSNTVVFHFNDADLAGTASDYVATVNTGDATLTSAANPGNVMIVANGGGGFDVQLSYTYAEELTGQTFSVSVTDHAATTSQSISTFSVADAALSSLATDLTPPAAVEGAAITSAVVFHFSDADPAGTASDYVATVNTGDATLTSAANPGNVMIVANGGGGFDVQLSYTYAEELTGQTFSVSVTDHAATTSQSISTFSVADAALSSLATDLTPPAAVEGAAITSAVVFHFSDADPAGTASDYVATGQYWGCHVDTKPAANLGNVTIVANGGGGFDVQLSYTYAEELTGQTFSVSVTDHAATTSQSISTFSVADRNVVATAQNFKPLSPDRRLPGWWWPRLPIRAGPRRSAFTRPPSIGAILPIPPPAVPSLAMAAGTITLPGA